MAGIINLGKYLFVIPMVVFGVLHFMNAKDMAGMAPFGGQVMVYFTGLALLAASLSVIIGKYDKLACVLLALMLLIFALTIHLPGVMNAQDPGMQAASMGNFLKDVGLAGGALMAARLAKDPSLIG